MGIGQYAASDRGDRVRGLTVSDGQGHGEDLLHDPQGDLARALPPWASRSSCSLEGFVGCRDDLPHWLSDRPARQSSLALPDGPHQVDAGLLELGFEGFSVSVSCPPGSFVPRRARRSGRPECQALRRIRWPGHWSAQSPPAYRPGCAKGPDPRSQIRREVQDSAWANLASSVRWAFPQRESCIPPVVELATQRGRPKG